MHTTETIIAIYKDRLYYFALTFRLEDGSLFNSHINIDQFFYAYKLVESEASILDLPLIVLIYTSRVNFLASYCKGAEKSIFNLLDFEFWQDEGKLGELGLPFLFYGHSHAL